MLNWLYINKDSHAVGYGARKDTVGHVIGPWGWSADEQFLTMQGKDDVFVAKLERDSESGSERWVVYWDPESEILATTEVEEECKPVRLRRAMLLGMQSKYVRD